MIVNQMSTENINIIRKHTWEVPFRVSMYELEDGRRFVLLEGGKNKATAQTQPGRSDVNMELSGVISNRTNNPSTIRNC